MDRLTAIIRAVDLRLRGTRRRIWSLSLQDGAAIGVGAICKMAVTEKRGLSADVLEQCNGVCDYSI